MNAGSSRGFRGKSSSYLDKRIFEQPENVGNRKTFDEIKIPPDNVGNKIDRDPIATFIHDGLGNSLDDEPSHLKSGILPQLSSQRNRPIKKSLRQNLSGDLYNGDERQAFSHFDTVLKKTEKVAKIRPLLSSISQKKKLAPTKVSQTLIDDDYIALLAQDFAASLNERVGTPFSFSMKTVIKSNVHKEELDKSLDALKLLIEGIFKITTIDATVYYFHYCTEQHRFAVFFVNPEEKDPVKNKDLISALRQVVTSHVAKFISDDINVLLVLANAKNIIEGHLAKIGAVKDEE